MVATRDVLFVGSLPVPDTETCFREVGAVLGDVLKRVPDGETGRRAKFIDWQLPLLGAPEQFEVREIGSQAEWGPNGELPPRAVQLKPGATGRPDFGPTGYADAAIESYRIFRDARAAGSFPASTRFQVGLPTPLGVLTAFMEPDAQAVAAPAYADSFATDVSRICAEIPAEDLTLQWDVPLELAVWEGCKDTYLDDDRTACLDQLAVLIELVPEGAEVGLHLCYGDVSHQHWKEPDLAVMAEFTNAVTARLNRPLDYVHMPIPRDWKDSSDYAALEQFDLPERTQMFLGLLHMTDGVEGAKARIAAAREHRRSFGVSTSCGLGRRDPAILGGLLSLHAEAARIP
ncbi:MAG: hypothetical protein RLT05_10620 [Bauldia litoralis]